MRFVTAASIPLGIAARRIQRRRRRAAIDGPLTAVTTRADADGTAVAALNRSAATARKPTRSPKPAVHATRCADRPIRGSIRNGYASSDTRLPKLLSAYSQ